MSETFKATIREQLASIALQLKEIQNHEEWRDASPELKEQLADVFFQNQLLQYLWTISCWGYRQSTTEENTTKIKIQSLLSQLNFVETASVIHTATEALRHECGFARCFADLGINIPLLNSTEEDCDWMREELADIRDTKELVSLIILGSIRLQTLSRQLP